MRAELLGTTVIVHRDAGVAGPAPARARAARICGARTAWSSSPAGTRRSRRSSAAWSAAPVIGVPTSTGYGATFGGVSALLAMMTSCAAGVAVVNIDDGFGAGTIAARIARGGAARPRRPGVILYVDCIGGVAGDMLLGALIDAGAHGRAARPRHRRAAHRARQGRAARDQRDDRDRAAARPASRIGTGPRSATRSTPPTCPSAPKARAQQRVREARDRRGPHPRDRARAGALPRGRGGRRDRRGRRRRARARVAGHRPRSSARRCPSGAASSRPPTAACRCPRPRRSTLLEGAPIHGVDIPMELVTPTGAALVASLADAYGPIPAMTVEGSGYGAGTRDLEALPNVVRVILGSDAAHRRRRADRGQPRRPAPRARARRRRGLLRRRRARRLDRRRSR